MDTENRREWLENLAAWVVGRGISAPAVTLLEIIKPFSFVSSQLLLIIEPLVGKAGRQYAWLLEDRQNIEQLQKLLEGDYHHPSV